jgi:sarcosine oxidase subunit beta
MTLPRTAEVVIIGGGVVGCSIAYHLARRGVPDVLVLERDAVGAGTTSKAAGGIRSQFSTETEILFSIESIGVFERFEEEFGVDPGYRKIGYLFLVAEADDLRGFRTRVALQRGLGVDVRVITPADAKALVPALHVDDLIAAVWGPDDGMAGPAEVTSGSPAWRSPSTRDGGTSSSRSRSPRSRARCRSPPTGAAGSTSGRRWSRCC